MLAAMSMPVLTSCGKKEINLGTQDAAGLVERPIYSEPTARVNYKLTTWNSIVENLTITLPVGNFRVSIFDIKLSGSKGTDSIKGASTIFSQSYSSNGNEGPLPINTGKIYGDHSFMTISGHGPKGDLQQTIFFKLKENQIPPSSDTHAPPK